MKKTEEEEHVQKAVEESEKNRVDFNMAEDCEWGRLSPLSTSWALIAFSVVELAEQPKASGSQTQSKTPGRKRSAPSVGELPIPCWTCEKKGEPGKCARSE